MGLSDVTDLALAEIRERSKLRLYRTDFQAWKWDVLGLRTYGLMEEIWDTALFGERPRTVIKSANGTAKSYEMSLAVAWSASVFEPGETVSIISAPSVSQIEKVIFAYLKSHYGRGAGRGFAFPGWIDESLGWKYAGPAGNIFLAFGRKPPSQDAVSVFQGVRSQFGNTNVFFDEAGGMDRAMYTAAEAVMTGSGSRFVGIGNPDNAGSEFQRLFVDPKISGEYNSFTISAFDLPTLTGERVYPRTSEGDEMEALMLRSLTSREWVEHKQRIWGEGDARYLAKVLGEFPGQADSAFFPQHAIDRAYDVEIVEDLSVRPVLGVDVARYGQDESVVYCNRGGRVRLLDSWGKTDVVESARKVHAHANALGAVEVRIDSAGIGGGVFDVMESLVEFQDRTYSLIGIDGGTRSMDLSRWANSRAYNHDSLREQMTAGLLDLDIGDDELREQLQSVTFKFTDRGGVQITPKDQLRTVMGGSPDRLDALIYATVDLGWLTGAVGPRPGDRLNFDAADVLGDEFVLVEDGMPWGY